MSESNHHVLIVGSGFAGLGMAIRLKQAGIQDFTILEQAGEVGGTWRDNHYPGAACDIPSHLYSFSFEPNPRWTRMFAPQPEILQYLIHCADKYGLRPHLRFHTAATAATFDERTGLWEVATRTGETLKARVLISGCGGLSKPAYPDIRGLGSFRGTAFHTARWDDSYPFAGKTIGVIGTGASAIQAVPEIAPLAKRLYLFQRTPPWIMPRPDRAITSFERALFRRWPFLQQIFRRALYLLLEARGIAFVVRPDLMRFAEKEARRFLKKSVPDPALRTLLTPDYTVGCKRILISNNYYPALLRDNVELITEPIAEVRPRGVVTRDGQQRQVDALLLCTGFQASEAAAPFAVLGRQGRDLDTAWHDGPQAYLGTTVAGFPNLFFIVGPNTGLGHNSMVYMIESQIQYILDCIQTMRLRGLSQIDVRQDVQERYNVTLQERLSRTVWASGCKSWYLTRSGRNTTLWPGFTFEFRKRTRSFDPVNYEVIGSDPTP